MPNKEHVEILKQGVKAWNKWREQMDKTTPDFRPDLNNVDFTKDVIEDAWESKFIRLEKINLSNTDLTGAKFCFQTKVAPPNKVSLQGAVLSNANLIRAELRFVILKWADLRGAKLIKADLWKAESRGADLSGAEFSMTKLQNADFTSAIVDNKTRIERCEVDKKTDFNLVALDSIRIDSATKQLLQYNIRKKRWNEWFKDREKGRREETGLIWKILEFPIIVICMIMLSMFFILKKIRWPWEEVPYSWKEGRRLLRKIENCFIRMFWFMCDYGRSTKRVILSFIVISLLFAAVYAGVLYLCPPGIICELAVEPHEQSLHYHALIVVRSVYFSVVTMTTLGFGDMFASSKSIWGHVLLMIQVLLGYVMLGALVTRFAVLFTAGGPAGQFKPYKEENKKIDTP